MREVDALRWRNGEASTRPTSKMKMLNTGKVPAVRALRAQADKELLKEMRRKDEKQDVALRPNYDW